jgi:hypothetical protein
MKKLSLIICFWGISWSVLFSSPILLSSETLSDTQIFSRNARSLELQGSFQTGVIRSFSTPFQVTQSTSFLTVNYLITLSTIHIEIVDESGEAVYSSTVNSVSGSQLFIDTDAWADGNYSIHFTNNAGGHIYAEFEILN